MQGGARAAEGGGRVTEADPEIGPGHQRACAGHPHCKVPGTLNLERAPCWLSLDWTQTSVPHPLPISRAVVLPSLYNLPASGLCPTSPNTLIGSRGEFQGLMHTSARPLRDSSAVSDGGTRQRGIRRSRLSSAWRLHVAIKRDGLISSFGDLVAC